MNEVDKKILSRVEILEWVDRVFSIPNKNRNFSERHVSLLLGKSPQYLREIYYRNFGITELMQVRFSRIIHELGEPEKANKYNPQFSQTTNGTRDALRHEIPEEVYIKFAQAVAALPWGVAKDYGLQTYIIKTCKNGGVPRFYKKTLRRLYRRITGEPFNY